MSENLIIQLRPAWKDARIGLPSSICERLQIKDKEMIIAFGTFRTKAKCIQETSNRRSLIISSRLANHMGLANGDQLKIKYEDGLLKIGPLIAIFTDGGMGTVRPFGEQTKFLRELSELARTKHYLVCVFTTKDVQWERRQISGLVAEEDDVLGWVWRRRTMPFPQVFYDRFISYRLKKPDLLLKRKLMRQAIPYFNGVMGDKRSMHQKYTQHPALVPHLPETREFQGGLLQPWLNKHKVIYIKPRLGTQGKGIIKISKSTEGYRACCVSKEGLTQNYKTNSLVALQLKVISWINGAKCIIQQGIYLATVEGRTVDYRVLAQKGIEGRWQVTGMVARVGKKGSVINNLHGGGDVMEVRDALESYFGNQPMFVQKIMLEMEKVTKLVCHASEQDKRFLGELGVDLGVDTNGKVWVIEANPKPGRSVFSRLKAYEQRRQAVIQPMNYAAYIAGFGIPQVSKGEDGYETV